tara:strand:- start:8794 stop:9981 length:1188 start_codon:yes stop_codon:yes gene_type:complete
MSEDFRPLAGIRVVEMTHMIMGPSCGMFLALMGAEVIKVEPPQGDKTRNLTGMGSPFFPLFNRGKLSVQLDLTADAGRKALECLLATADIFVDNFRDQSLTKMGVNAAGLRRKFPNLILASHKGFLDGPYKERTAMDEVVQMMTGLAYMTGPRGRPLRFGSSAIDIFGGLFGAFSAMGALMERKISGKGRDIRVGLFESGLLLAAQHMVQFELEGTSPPPMPERDFSWPVYDIFETADTRQIFVGAVTESQWETLCVYLRLDELLTDERLQTRMDQINARGWTIPIVGKAIAKQNYGQLLENFERLGIPFSPINKPAELFEDPHVLRDGGLVHSNTADGRTFRAPALPFEVDGRMMDASGDLPSIGQETNLILSELGFSPTEIEAARGPVKATAN